MKKLKILLLLSLVAVLCLSSCCVVACNSHKHTLVKHDAVTATCTQNGNIAYWQCAECGLYFSDSEATRPIDVSQTVVTVGHASSDWIVDVEPTCINSGSKHTECTVCGAILSNTTIAVWGEHRDLDNNGKCDGCGAVLPHDHTADDWVIAAEPTCIYQGNQYQVCTICGEHFNDMKTGPILGAHADEDGNCYCDMCQQALPHSDSDGDFYCDICGNILEHVHTADSWVVERVVTCLNDGYKYQVCTICGEQFNGTVIDRTTDVHPDSDHNCFCDVCGLLLEHTDENRDCVCDYCGWVLSHKDSDGDFHCDVCNAVLEHDHASDKWIVGREPTCMEDGYKYKLCDICGEIFTDAGIDRADDAHIDADCDCVCDRCSLFLEHVDGDTDCLCDVCQKQLPHADKDSNCVCDNCGTALPHKDSDCDFHCDNCGKVLEHVHIADSWVVERVATCLRDGYKYQVCTICGEQFNGTVIGSTPDVHLDTDDNCICDVCGLLLEHIDENCDCVCDYCGWALSHKDSDGDFYCDVCNVVLEHTHISDEWIIVEEPTCVSMGYKHKNCEICGNSFDETSIEPDSSKHCDDNSDCFCDICGTLLQHIDSNGDFYCDICNVVLDHTHISDEWIIVGEPTCVSMGNKYKNCEICGDRFDETTIGLDSNKHRDDNCDCVCDDCSNDLPHIDKNNDCVCDNCSCIVHVDVDCDCVCDQCGSAIEHYNWDGDCYCDNCGAPMHLNSGYSCKCVNCGAQLQHTEETIFAVSPTCTDFGYTSGVQCCFCGIILVEPQQIEMLPHNCVNGKCKNCSYIEPTPFTYTLSYYSATVTGYQGEDTDLVIPQYIAGLPVRTIAANAFSQSAITSVTIPESVTSLGAQAFYGCSSLGTIYFNAENCQAVKYEDQVFAYSGRSDGVNLVIGKKVRQIPDYLFCGKMDSGSGAPKIRSVVFEEDSCCTSIGKNVFRHNKMLESIVLPDSITSMGENVFYYCSALTSVTIPSGITKIDMFAFTGCTALETVIFKEGSRCTSIGYEAFCLCSSLTSIELPNGITSIGYRAFYYCAALSDVQMPNSVTDIGEGAFSSCALTSITIPASVTHIAYSAFSSCFNLTAVNYNAVYAKVGNSTDPSSASNYVFANVGRDSSGVTLTVGASVKMIPDYLFCTYLTGSTANLVNIVFEENSQCQTVGAYAFCGCGTLRSVTLPDSITLINTHAFYDCVALEEINYNVTTHRDFADRDSIFHSAGEDGTGTTINIGANVQTLPARLFFGISGAANVVFAENSQCTSIGEEAFYASSLVSIDIPSSVTSIGERAFTSCTSLEMVCISDISAWCNISFAGSASNPLYYAHNLYLNGALVTNIEIPSTVINISSWAFYNCTSLTGVCITDLAAWCNISFANASSNPLALAHNLYLNGQLVTELEIPSTITAIKQYAFYGWNGTSVTIHEDIANIEKCAFYKCTVLTEINYNATAAIVPTTDSVSSNKLFYNAGQDGAGITVNIGENVRQIPSSLFHSSYEDSSCAPKISSSISPTPEKR